MPRISLRRTLLMILTVLGLVESAYFSAIAKAAEYSVTQTLQVGGDGGFDYVTLDPEGKTLYLPRASHTQVVEAASGKVLADVPDNSGSHGVALVPEPEQRLYQQRNGRHSANLRSEVESDPRQNQGRRGRRLHYL